MKLDPQTVNIATLKANLAAYLRRAEAGESITVIDRKRPIARLVGLVDDRSDGLRIIPRTAKPSELAALKLQSVKTELPDIVALLLEDRKKR